MGCRSASRFSWPRPCRPLKWPAELPVCLLRVEVCYIASFCSSISSVHHLFGIHGFFLGLILRWWCWMGVRLPRLCGLSILIVLFPTSICLPSMIFDPSYVDFSWLWMQGEGAAWIDPVTLCSMPSRRVDTIELPNRIPCHGHDESNYRR
jgi:hypothetical protein